GFMFVDPLAEDFAEWTPYNYTLNNPINLVDSTGMAPESPDCDGCKGFLFTVVDNVLGTNLRNTYATDSKAYRTGVQTGHTASLTASVVLAVDGTANIGAGTAGLVVALTGVGTVPAGVTATGSGLLVAKGVTEVAAAAHIGSTTVRNMNSDKAQKTHFHSTRNGEKMKGKDNIHYENRNSRRNER